MFTYSLFIINNFFMSETFSHPDVLCSPGGGGKLVEKSTSSFPVWESLGGRLLPHLGGGRGEHPPYPCKLSIQSIHPSICFHPVPHSFSLFVHIWQVAHPHLKGNPRNRRCGGPPTTSSLRRFLSRNLLWHRKTFSDGRMGNVWAPCLSLDM